MEEDKLDEVVVKDGILVKSSNKFRKVFKLE